VEEKNITMKYQIDTFSKLDNSFIARIYKT